MLEIFYNKRSVLNADLGMSAALSNELELGVIIKNATLSKIAEYNNERLTTNFQIGASYHFSKDLIVQTGLEKTLTIQLHSWQLLIINQMKK